MKMKLSMIFSALLFVGAANAQTSLYSEDFESGTAQNWMPQNSSEWSVVKNNKTFKHYYRSYSRTPASYSNSMVSVHNNQYTDFIYSASLRNTDTFATYIIFRATSNFTVNSATGNRGSGYAFGIDADTCGALGSFYIYKLTDGILETIMPWTNAPSIKCDKLWNKLKVVVQGEVLKFFINGEIVYKYTDSSPIQSGMIGVLGYTRDTANTKHYFDNISVSSTSSQKLGTVHISSQQKAFNATPSKGSDPSNASE